MYHNIYYWKWLKSQHFGLVNKIVTIVYFIERTKRKEKYQLKYCINIATCLKLIS